MQWRPAVQWRLAVQWRPWRPAVPWRPTALLRWVNVVIASWPINHKYQLLETIFKSYKHHHSLCFSPFSAVDHEIKLASRMLAELSG